MAGSKNSAPTTLQEKFAVLHTLGLPVGHAVVTGTLPLEVAGVNVIHSDDIDVLCDQETWLQYAQHPKAVWHTFPNGTRSFSVLGAEFFTDLPDLLSDAAPKVAHALSETVVVEGIPFLSIGEVYDWKLRVSRPKDIDHIKKVDAWVNASPFNKRDWQDQTRTRSPKRVVSVS